MLGREVCRVDDVLYRDRQAVQRPWRAAQFPLFVGALGSIESGSGIEMREGPHVWFERFDPIKMGAHNRGGGRVPRAYALDERERRFLRDPVAHWLAAWDEGDQASSRVNKRSIAQ